MIGLTCCQNLDCFRFLDENGGHKFMPKLEFVEGESVKPSPFTVSWDQWAPSDGALQLRVTKAVYGATSW